MGGGAKAAGARYAVFTATHFEGFLNWQSDIYPYGVKQAPWRNGNGDIVADFVASCRKFGLKPGLYFSTMRNAYQNVNDGRKGDKAAGVQQDLRADAHGNVLPIRRTGGNLDGCGRAGTGRRRSRFPSHSRKVSAPYHLLRQQSAPRPSLERVFRQGHGRLSLLEHRARTQDEHGERRPRCSRRRSQRQPLVAGFRRSPPADQQGLVLDSRQ